MRSRILSVFLLEAFQQAAWAAASGYVPKAAELREAPSASARAIAQLPGKRAVEILGRNGSWVRIQAGDNVGWVRTIDVRFESPPAAKSATARAKSSSASGVRGFSEDDLLAGTPSPDEMEKFKRMALPAREAATFARSAGLKPRKQ